MKKKKRLNMWTSTNGSFWNPFVHERGSDTRGFLLKKRKLTVKMYGDQKQSK